MGQYDTESQVLGQEAPEALLELFARLRGAEAIRPRRDEIMREGKRSMKIKELVEGTWRYDEIRDEGREEGREEGRLPALREMIRRRPATARRATERFQ